MTDDVNKDLIVRYNKTQGNSLKSLTDELSFI